MIFGLAFGTVGRSTHFRHTVTEWVYLRFDRETVAAESFGSPFFVWLCIDKTNGYSWNDKLFGRPSDIHSIHSLSLFFLLSFRMRAWVFVFEKKLNLELLQIFLDLFRCIFGVFMLIIVFLDAIAQLSTFSLSLSPSPSHTQCSNTFLYSFFISFLFFFFCRCLAFVTLLHSHVSAHLFQLITCILSLFIYYYDDRVLYLVNVAVWQTAQAISACFN